VPDNHNLAELAPNCLRFMLLMNGDIEFSECSAVANDDVARFSMLMFVGCYHILQQLLFLRDKLCSSRASDRLGDL